MPGRSCDRDAATVASILFILSIDVKDKLSTREASVALTKPRSQVVALNVAPTWLRMRALFMPD